jgi:RNA polymerase sigma factor (sigma-70 family)
VTGRSPEEERFVVLMRELGDPIRRYVVRRAPADLVDDVVAEVFLVVWRRLADVPTDEPLPWTYGVARNCLANATRSDRRQRAVADKVVRLDPPRAYQPESGHAEADHDELHEAMAELSDIDRELIALWAWEELPPRQIAESLGMTANAVSIRLTRAKQKLAELLRKNQAASGQIPGEGRGR